MEDKHNKLVRGGQGRSDTDVQFAAYVVLAAGLVFGVVILSYLFKGAA